MCEFTDEAPSHRVSSGALDPVVFFSSFVFLSFLQHSHHFLSICTASLLFN
jgi:hypothetical protein